MKPRVVAAVFLGLVLGALALIPSSDAQAVRYMRIGTGSGGIANV